MVMLSRSPPAVFSCGVVTVVAIEADIVSFLERSELNATKASLRGVLMQETHRF